MHVSAMNGLIGIRIILGLYDAILEYTDNLDQVPSYPP